MERLTTRDLAARTHLAPQTILNYVKEGTITPINISPDGRYYFDMSVADELITRTLLKKYPNHTAIVVLYTDEDSMKTFENTYTNYLNEEGILRIDNLTEKVSEVRERVEGNALHDRLILMLREIQYMGMYRCLTDTLEYYEKRLPTMYTDLQLQKMHCRLVLREMVQLMGRHSYSTQVILMTETSQQSH